MFLLFCVVLHCCVAPTPFTYSPCIPCPPPLPLNPNSGIVCGMLLLFIVDLHVFFSFCNFESLLIKRNVLMCGVIV